MRNKSRWLALMLTGSMVISPLSYTKAYASENEQYKAIQQSLTEIQDSADNKQVGETGSSQENQTEETIKDDSSTSSDGQDTAGNDQISDTDKEQNPTENGNDSDSTYDGKTDGNPAGNEEGTENTEKSEAEANDRANNIGNNVTNLVEDTAAQDAKTTSEQKEAEIGNDVSVLSDIVPVQPTAAIDGVKILKNEGVEYRMMPVTDATYQVKGNSIEISFKTGKKTTFDRLYLGAVTDADKSGYIQGSKTGSTVEFTVTVPLSKRNSWIPIAAGRSDKDSWSENYLWMSIPDVLVITGQPQSVNCKAGETASFTVSMEEKLAGKYRCVVKDKTGAESTSDEAEAKFGKTNEKEDYTSNDGISTIYGSDDKKKPGQPYSMFKIASSQSVVKGNQIEVTLWVSPASSGNFTYDAIYIGHKDDVTKEPIVLGEVDTTKNLEKFVFTVPVSKAGGEVNFVPRSAKTGKWSTSSSLAFKIPALEDFQKPAQINITKQPESKVAGAGKQVTLSVEADGDNKLSYQWQYSKDGNEWTDCSGDGSRSATYEFTMSEALEGQYRCVVSDETGVTAVSSAATVELPGTPTVTGDTVKVVKEDSKEFTMFKVSKSEVTKEGDELEITLETNNVSFDAIYLGSKDDALKSSVIEGTQLTNGGWSFTFRVPAADAGQVIPVALRKAKDQTWYSNQYLWMYIPSENIKDLPVVSDEVKTIAGGTGASYGDFNIASSKAVLRGDTVTLTLNVKGNKWTKL